VMVQRRMAGLGLEDELPQEMSLTKRMSTVVFPIGRPAVMDCDAAPGTGPRDPTLFVPAPDLSRSTGLSAGVTGATLTDPSPWRIPCLLAVRAPVVAGAPSGAAVPADDEFAPQTWHWAWVMRLLAAFPPALHGRP